MTKETTHSFHFHFQQVILTLVIGFCLFGIAMPKSTLAAVSPTPKQTAAPSRTQSPTLEPTPRLEPTTPDETTTEALLNRINQKVETDEQTTVQKTLETIDKLRQAYLGEVEKVTDESIRVKLASGTSIIAIEDMENVRKNGKKIKPTDIEVGNWIVAIGATKPGSSMNTISPDKVLVYTSSPRPQPVQVAAGTMQSLNGTNITLLSRADGENVTFSLLKTTRFLDDTGKIIKSSALPDEVSVLVTGYTEGEKKIATTVRSLAPLAKETKGN